MYHAQSSPSSARALRITLVPAAAEGHAAFPLSLLPENTRHALPRNRPLPAEAAFSPRPVLPSPGSTGPCLRMLPAPRQREIAQRSGPLPAAGRARLPASNTGFRTGPAAFSMPGNVLSRMKAVPLSFPRPYAGKEDRQQKACAGLASCQFRPAFAPGPETVFFFMAVLLLKKRPSLPCCSSFFLHFSQAYLLYNTALSQILHKKTGRPVWTKSRRHVIS